MRTRTSRAHSIHADKARRHDFPEDSRHPAGSRRTRGLTYKFKHLHAIHHNRVNAVLGLGNREHRKRPRTLQARFTHTRITRRI